MKPAPSPARMRVVTLGDSLAYGAGDESGQGIAGRLSDELSDRDIDADVLNLGVNGSQTSDLAARLRTEAVRREIAHADSIILSIGANDLFRSPAAREETMRAPLAVAERILVRIETIIAELHRINPSARVLIIGGYNPVPQHAYGPIISRLVGIWDGALAERFEDDRRVRIVPVADIVTPARLSRLDGFHPGGDAYAEIAQRIGDLLRKSSPE